ncbi:hypothetical protein GCM10012320_35690 [Sinomonas cellulolyticus]|nr:hypothetical protein GCM10012320_35690 [Sinomonas sp. KCTC 49339]
MVIPTPAAARANAVAVSGASWAMRGREADVDARLDRFLPQAEPVGCVDEHERLVRERGELHGRGRGERVVCGDGDARCVVGDDPRAERVHCALACGEADVERVGCEQVHHLGAAEVGREAQLDPRMPAADEPGDVRDGRGAHAPGEPDAHDPVVVAL